MLVFGTRKHNFKRLIYCKNKFNQNVITEVKKHIVVLVLGWVILKFWTLETISKERTHKTQYYGNVCHTTAR